MTVALDPRQSVHIARQPILDANRRVCGYELLYRANGTDRTCTTSGELAAARVLTDAILGIGLDSITGGAPAFLNFTRELLLDDAAALLPSNAVVIELREDIVVDAEVIAACEELTRKGYRVALDDFVADSSAEALLPYASFIKLDVRDTPPIVWQPLAHRLASPDMHVVAERVETVDVVSQARDAGCTYFQGYYFCRPATHSAKALPARRLAYLNLFSAVNRPDLTIGELEDLVKRDVSLTMRVLRSINSAAFGLKQEITSVRHALVLLGIQHVRKWASVWSMAGLNSGGTPEVVSIALLRARSCEVIGNQWLGADAGAELFLLGMCSMLDAIVDQPMEKAVSGLQLTPGVRDALLGDKNEMRAILDAVIAHEQGDWDAAAATMQQLGLSAELPAAAYADALRWSRDISSTAAAA
jgi:EAL and modified HD-GYP domain-containing signal transduction protein